jgi:hypothetical protein
MTRVDVRMAFRLHRFEIVLLGGLILALAVAAVVTAAQLDVTGYGANCPLDGTDAPGCEARGKAFYAIEQAQVPMIRALAIALTYLLAVMLGAPLVARELERGTSRLAWSLAPSRVRWLLSRVIPAAVVVAAVSMIAGAALTRMAAAEAPWVDLANSFDDFGSRGVGLAARATFVFGLAVALGALTGRMLPALLLTAVLGYLSIVAGTFVQGRILQAEATWVATDSGTGALGDLYFDQRVRLADGRVVGADEAFAMIAPDASDNGSGLPRGATMEALVVPGSRSEFVQAREASALAGGALASIATAGVIVRRRRPG